MRVRNHDCALVPERSKWRCVLMIAHAGTRASARTALSLLWLLTASSPALSQEKTPAQSSAARTVGNEVAGSYRIERMTDRGAEVRVTVRILLVNVSGQNLSIAKITMRERHRPEKQESSSVSAELQPSGSATFEQDVVLSRSEFERWKRGAHAFLEVKLQPVEGRPVLRTIALQPARARRTR